MSAWQFIAEELDGTPIGELLNVQGRKVGIGVRRVASLEGTLRLDHPLADVILSGQALVKAYRRGAMMFHGPVVAAQEVNVGGNATVAFTAADPLWRLTHRFIGKFAGGYVHGTASAMVDRSTIISTILGSVNGEAYSGLDVGTVTASTSSYVAWAPYKQALEAIQEVAAPLGGPDFYVEPMEAAPVTGGTRLGRLNVGGTIGTYRPAAAFEAGPKTRGNVAEWRRSIDLGGLANIAYVLPPSTDPTAAVVTSGPDTASQATYGLHAAVVSGDLASVDLRQRLADENVRLRKVPRQTITFTPTRDDPARPGRVPQYGQDFAIGDTIPFRAVATVQRTGQATNEVRVDASLRIYNIEFQIDDDGAETPSLTLSSS